ncbi:transcription antitermination regulator [Mycolicibacterium anyangense]|uniref:Transcription antitermination regulator n=1 Tax=Mycolicibacterium anyangense TaxID=1431246 RepID=A0A6N4WHW6_9MYCO|nr:GAF and ANTAR domain-containing protein [Mycolicibacterium anyangense]BBZ79512.1 transcription antitermination regulator [Mycolicibacterium anyangense]
MPDYDAQPGRRPPPEPELSADQLRSDELDLKLGLDGLARIVPGACTVDDLLRQVAQFAVQAIPGVDAAGVTLAHPGGVVAGDSKPRIQTCSVTEEFVRAIDTLQYEEFNEGPCLTCMHTRRPAASGSLGGDRRWPHFGGRVARMGVRSVLALPLIVDEQVIGAINSYAHSRDAFTEHAVTLGVEFARPAAVSVYNAQLLNDAWQHTARLQAALSSRGVIDQAIGIIRSRSGGTEREAFDRLARISQNEHIKVSEVADRVVDEAVRRARARQQ